MSFGTSFRANCIRQAEAEVGIAPSITAKDSDDRGLPGCQHIVGASTPELVRQILLKSAPTDTPGEYKCHTTTWQAFTSLEKAKVGKVTVYAFREFCRNWKMPDELVAEYQRALMEYANVVAQPLRDNLQLCGVGPGGPLRGRSDGASVDA